MDFNVHLLNVENEGAEVTFRGFNDNNVFSFSGYNEALIKAVDNVNVNTLFKVTLEKTSDIKQSFEVKGIGRITEKDGSDKLYSVKFENLSKQMRVELVIDDNNLAKEFKMYESWAIIMQAVEE